MTAAAVRVAVVKDGTGGSGRGKWCSEFTTRVVLMGWISSQWPNTITHRTHALVVPQVQLCGLSDGMETLICSARRRPDALAALQAAGRHPHALKHAVENGFEKTSKYAEGEQDTVVALERLWELGLLEHSPVLASGTEQSSPFDACQIDACCRNQDRDQGRDACCPTCNDTCNWLGNH